MANELTIIILLSLQDFLKQFEIDALYTKTDSLNYYNLNLRIYK
jgi:hypothetical protein